MYEYVHNIYESIVAATNSELVLFFVIFFVFLCVALVPAYTLMLKDRKDRRKGYVESENIRHSKHLEREDKMIERESRILDVIQKNTEVISGLKMALESSGADTKHALERIHVRIDGAEKTLLKIATDIAKLSSNSVKS